MVDDSTINDSQVGNVLLELNGLDINLEQFTIENIYALANQQTYVCTFTAWRPMEHGIEEVIFSSLHNEGQFFNASCQMFIISSILL